MVYGRLTQYGNAGGRGRGQGNCRRSRHRLRSYGGKDIVRLPWVVQKTPEGGKLEELKSGRASVKPARSVCHKDVLPRCFPMRARTTFPYVNESLMVHGSALPVARLDE